MDWFLYDIDLRHEIVKRFEWIDSNVSRTDQFTSESNVQKNASQNN